MSYFKLPFITALVVLAAACCSSVGKQTMTGPHTVGGPTCGLTLQMRELLILHNTARRNNLSCGDDDINKERPELVWNCQLHEIALRHTRDMLDNGWLSHRSSNGDSLTQRLDQNGYGWRAAAENISSGYVDASSVAQGWFGSRGHCRNMLSAQYREFGAARVGDYWTVIFASPF